MEEEKPKDNFKAAGKHKFFKIGDYILNSTPIGYGTFAEVFLAQNRERELFAVKKIKESRIKSKEAFKQLLNSEIKITYLLDNEHIVRLLDIKRTKENIYLFFEYCNCETLGNFLKNYTKKFNHGLPLDLVQHFSSQIIQGIYYMYLANCIHRDLKLENIMLDHKKGKALQKKELKKFMSESDVIPHIEDCKASTVADEEGGENKEIPFYYNITDEKKFKEAVQGCICKLIDLGFAKCSESEVIRGSFCGTSAYMAPEVWDVKFRGVESYTYKIDLWSLGVCIYKLTFSKLPFFGETNEKIKNLVDDGKYKIPKVEGLTLELVDLIEGLLQINPDTRYDYETLFSHPFFLTCISDQIPFDYEGKDYIILDGYCKKYTIEIKKQTPSEKFMSMNLEANAKDITTNFDVETVFDEGVFLKSILYEEDYNDDWVIINNNWKLN